MCSTNESSTSVAFPINLHLFHIQFTLATVSTVVGLVVLLLFDLDMFNKLDVDLVILVMVEGLVRIELVVVAVALLSLELHT